jgi:hypothetical protein
MAPRDFRRAWNRGCFPWGRPRITLEEKPRCFPKKAVILVIEVLDEIIAVAKDEFFPLSQGIVQFDPGRGLEELQAAWPTLAKYLAAVELP